MPDSILPATPTVSKENRQRGLIVAIDGPTGAGKSTIARGLARRLGALYIDTGAMYRAVAYTALQRGLDASDENAVTLLAQGIMIRLLPPATDDSDAVRVLVDRTEITPFIRTPEISQLTSKISAISGVRRSLVAQQRSMGAEGAVVMEGRDIGSVVFPDADVKIYLTATPAERARRRQAQLAESGTSIDLEALTHEIEERDVRDSSRADSPLVQANDAVLVLSDGLTEEEVVDRLLELCEEAAKRHG